MLAMIVRLLLGAAFTAMLHHVYLFILQGYAVSSQFWIKNSSNALSTLFQWLCAGSVSVSLPQLVSSALYSTQNDYSQNRQIWWII